MQKMNYDFHLCGKIKFSYLLSKTHKDKKIYKASDLFNEKVKKGGAVI
jgi:hypothetical protein